MAWRKKRGKKYLVEWRFPVGDPTARTYSRGGFGTAAAADAFKKLVDDTLASGKNWEPPRAAEPEAVRPGDMMTAAHAYLDFVEGTRAQGTARNRTLSLDLLLRFLEGEGVTAPTLSVLSKSMLARFFAWLRKPESSKRGGRAPDAVRKTVEHVQLFWAWCADDDTYLDVTPRARKLDEIKLVRSPRTPTRAPTWAEMDATLALLGAHLDVEAGPRFAHLILVCAIERCTGLRVSQAERLIVSDPDFETRILTFRGELGKSHEERAGRLLPMAPPLVELFAALATDRAGADLLVPSHLAFVEQYRRRLLRQAWVDSNAPKAVWHHRPNHCFRKGFSSELARAGVSPEVRDILTGHSTGLAGVYTDHQVHPLAEAVALVPAFSEAAYRAVMKAVSTLIASLESLRTPSGPNASSPKKRGAVAPRGK